MGAEAGRFQPIFYPTSENISSFFPDLRPAIYDLLSSSPRPFFRPNLSLFRAILSLNQAILSLIRAILSLHRANLSLNQAILSLPERHCSVQRANCSLPRDICSKQLEAGEGSRMDGLIPPPL